MSGRYRLAVVFILGDGNSTLTGNGENSVLKTPGSVVTGNLIALFGCCAAGRINGIKVYRICVRGIITTLESLTTGWQSEIGATVVNSLLMVLPFPSTKR